MHSPLLLGRPILKDATTMQGVFPTSSANITCLPYTMWPGCRDEVPFLLVLDRLNKEHLERGRRVHSSHFKRILKYRRDMKGQGWAWRELVELGQSRTSYGNRELSCSREQTCKL